MFGGDGAEHHTARHRVAAVFGPDAIDRHHAAITAIAEDEVRRWPRHRPFRLQPRLRTLVDRIFVERLLGVEDPDRARALVLATRRMLWTLGNPPSTLPGGGFRRVDVVGRAIFDRRRRPVARLVELELAARDGRARDGDLLDATTAGDPPLPGDAVIDELLPTLMAAQEPPAVALAWILDRLARDAVAAEWFAGGGAGADLSRDPIVRETLRRRPPALAALRRLTAPRDVLGHHLPAGTAVMVPIPLLHRDPAAFPQPHAFRPGRWATTPHDAPYLPFGAGARRCLGEHLARAYVATLVPAILRRIRLEPVRAEPERMVLRATILVPQRSDLVIAR